MEKPDSIKILDVCKVFPSDSLIPFSLPLTFLERLWLKVKPTCRIFFYELPDQDADFTSIFLPKLKDSLSRTLQHYLPLAGNLIWPQDSDLPVVQYSIGDGVSLTVAETLADFDYLSGDVFRESAELCSLLPNFSSSETLTQAMTLQITLFPKRGFSIGYVAHHAIMDGKSTSMFLHAWAYICRNGEGSILPLELIPSFDRTFLEQHTDLEKVYPKEFWPTGTETKALTCFDMVPPSNVMSGTFTLTRKNIEDLKNGAKSNTHVSSFTVTTAYVTICLLKAKEITADLAYLAFSADGRLRLDPPLPTTYFGSCLVPCGDFSDTKEFLSGDGFVTAINVITKTLASLNEGIVNVVQRKCRDPFSEQKSFVFFPIGGSPRFELYKVDFGLGKPRKVEIVLTHNGGAFYLSDDKNDKGGIEIGVALESHETEAFASVFASGLEAR